MIKGGLCPADHKCLRGISGRITGYDSYLAWEDAFYEKEDPPEEERALHQSLLDNTNVYTIGMLISFMDNYDRLGRRRLRDRYRRVH